MLNHLMDDLEDFITSVRERAAAWQELEKKKKKSKKRSGDGETTAIVRTTSTYSLLVDNFFSDN